MKFKTNVIYVGCASQIGEELNKLITPEQWSIDFLSAEKLLTIRADVSVKLITESIAQTGYNAELMYF